MNKLSLLTMMLAGGGMKRERYAPLYYSRHVSRGRSHSLGHEKQWEAIKEQTGIKIV